MGLTAQLNNFLKGDDKSVSSKLLPRLSGPDGIEPPSWDRLFNLANPVILPLKYDP